MAVVSDLAKVRDPEELQVRTDLLLSALSDEEARVRKGALLSLADVGATMHTELVARKLGDREIAVRQMAILALGELAEPGDEEMAGRIACFLRAGAPELRYQALLAHCRLLPEHAATDLGDALGDEDAEVRQLALRLIDELLLEELRCKEAPLLIERAKVCARDGDPHVSLLAQLVCSELRLDVPTHRIEQVVAGKLQVREPRDEQWAIALCGQRGLRQALPALRRRAFGWLGISFDAHRFNALAALVLLGDEKAAQRLVRGLSVRNFADRTRAAQALGESGHVAAQSVLKRLVGRESLIDQDVLNQALADLAQAASKAP